MRLCAFADEAGPSLSAQINALHRNGISLLEIRGVGEKNIKDITAHEALNIKMTLDREGIGVWSMGSPIGKYPLEKDISPHLDDFKRILESADILGAKHIRIFSFFPSAGDSCEETEKKVLDRLERLVELTPRDVILCHENEKRIFGETPEACLKIHKRFPSIRAVFDPANFIQCGVETLKAWELLAPYTEYMHIKDAADDGHIVPAGMGVGNIKEIVNDYFGRGGDVLTLEPHLKVFSGLSELEGGERVKIDGYAYKTQDEAFDAGASALKKILESEDRS